MRFIQTISNVLINNLIKRILFDVNNIITSGSISIFSKLIYLLTANFYFINQGNRLSERKFNRFARCNQSY